jgi:hypothetical protein
MTDESANPVTINVIPPLVPLTQNQSTQSTFVRPGRNPLRSDHSIDLTTSYGTSHHLRNDNDIRIFFQNTKGLTYSSTGEDYDYYLSCTKSIGANIIGMAETNTAWQHHHLRQLFTARTHQHFQIAKTSFSSPSIEIDPIPEKETFQSGGTITLSTRDLVPMAFGNDIKDDTGLGRWSGQTFRGKDSKILSVITGYRVCTGSIASSSIGSAFSREYEYHRSQAKLSPRPRKQFLTDLSELIQSLQTKGHAIILMMDSNGQVEDDHDIQNFLATCDLHDLHSSDPAPSTFIGHESRRIDHIFGCSITTQAMQTSGSLSYLEGPQSDHRGLFVDLDTEKILGQKLSHSPIAVSTLRPLKSGNPETVEAYHSEMLKYYDDHKMIQRIENLFQNYNNLSRSQIKRRLEEWDQDQGRAMRHAEATISKPSKPYEWSPKFRNSGILYRYWKLRLREVQHSENYSGTFDKMEQLIRQHTPSFDLPSRSAISSLEDIKSSLKVAETNMRKCQKDSIDLRFRSYIDLLATYENDTNPNTKSESKRKAKIVRNTLKSERNRAMYRNIRTVVKPSPHGGLSKLLLPRHRDSHIYPENFQELLNNTEETDIIWDTVLDKDTINSNLLKYNRQSFRAAAISPCGHGLIQDKLTYSSLSTAAASLLSGTVPYQWYRQDETLREFLTSFSIPDNVKGKKPISTEITAKDVEKGFRTWKETTSTSPSGRHLGHYKAIIQEKSLLKCLTQFMQITVASGLTLSRWCNAVSIMIEKDHGKPRLNRLRIIHLFEADFNFFLKLVWGSRLVKRTVELDLLNDGQHGSVPRRTALDPIMLTQLTTDLCQILKHNMARFDNDASACYDRIIVALGMLAARRCGMPDNAIKTHADALRLMKYTVKTIFGISEENYHGTPFAPLFGTGQGSGASPAVWLTLVVILMNTLDRIIPERMEFHSPDSKTRHSRLIDAFVDDTSMGFTDAGLCTLETLIEKLNRIAQTWEKLLYYSGGALNLQKCTWHVMHWDWKLGRPHLRPVSPQDPSLTLTTQGDTTTSTEIRRLPLTKASRILGVHLSPNGDFSKQLIVLKEKADTFAIRLRSPKLTSNDIQTFHRTMYAPAMRYVLPALAVDEEELAPIQSKVLASMLQKLGYSSKIPTSIRHGPIELGGLALIDLRTELGISNLKYMRDSIYSETEVGKLMTLNVKYSQIESGIKEPLLEHPGISISYLTPTWILSVRQFLSQHNMAITLTDTINVEIRDRYDCCIMNNEHLTRYTPTQKQDINLVRLHLQIITLSDMTRSDGIHACDYHRQGLRRPQQPIRIKTWPRQPLPTTSQRKIWTNYISSNYLRYGNKWRNPMRHLPAPPTTTFTSPTPPTTLTLQSFLKNLPKWHRRLLLHLAQPATDNEVFQSFRARSRLTIATDGSLQASAGTFGWKITNKTHLTLFQGSGPIDGPHEIGSSTRSELGGFTAPLLLITSLARHWGLKHRCKFRWLADSQVAINRVTVVTRKDYSPTKQPDNCDYLSTIKELYRELRRPIQAQWIKSHQDSRTPYAALSREAKLNVDADELATLCHNLPKSKPQRNIDHVPATKLSISILHTRFSGNLDSNIRYHINGGYLRAHLQKRKQWSDSVWDTIDWNAFGRHLRSMDLRHQPAHLKLIHGLLPLGTRRFMISSVPDPQLKLCPCCQLQDEDHPHLLQCNENPSREKATNNLILAITKDNHPSRPAFASCIQSYLSSPTTPVTFSNPKFPDHLKPLLHEAIEEQTIIGWHNLLLGFLSSKWKLLAAADIARQDKFHMDAGTRRTHQSLQHLFSFTRDIWLGRCEILHRDQETIDTKVYSVQSAEIRHFHENPALFPSADRHYCQISLQRLLGSRPSVRRRWIRRVRTARSNMIRDGNTQQRMTKFLERNQQHRNLRSDILDIPPKRNQALNRSITTQQRMTSFFPGRPPDSCTTSIPNPPPSQP